MDSYSCNVSDLNKIQEKNIELKNENNPELLEEKKEKKEENNKTYNNFEEMYSSFINKIKQPNSIKLIILILIVYLLLNSDVFIENIKKVLPSIVTPENVFNQNGKLISGLFLAFVVIFWS